MVEGLTLVRLKQRLAALNDWRAAGLSPERLAGLDRRVRHGLCTDFPGRGRGPELRVAGEPAEQRRQQERTEGTR